MMIEEELEEEEQRQEIKNRKYNSQDDGDSHTPRDPDFNDNPLDFLEKYGDDDDFQDLL